MSNSQAIPNNAGFASAEFSARRFWIWAFSGYILAEGLYWTLHYFNIYRQDAPWLLPAIYYIFQWLLNVLFTAFLWFFLDRFYRRNRWLTVLLNICLFAIHYTGWLLLTYYLFNSGAEWIVGERERAELTEFIYGSWFDIGKYMLKVTAFYVLKFYCEYRISERQRIRLAIINKDLQLNLLKQQLSPHFYFNTLNNLYGLARNNNPKLSQALQQLSNIMHYVIVECNETRVSLQKEIDFLQSYIALEKLRYEEDTVIDMQVEGKTNGHTILPLLLIQFVENAFKHGMKEKSEQNWMKVKMNIREHDISFSVANSYHTAEPAEGIGLSSVKHRLNLQYDGKYDMRMHTEDGRFSVNLQLNLS